MDDESDGDGGSDIEKQIAKEMSSMKRPRKEQRFGMFLYTVSFIYSNF